MKMILTLVGFLLFVCSLNAQDYPEAQARFEKAQNSYSKYAAKLESKDFSPEIFAFANFEVHEVYGKAHYLGDNILRVDLQAYEAGAGWTGGKYFYIDGGRLAAVQLYFIERQDGATVEAPFQIFFYENGDFTGAVDKQGKAVQSDAVSQQSSENMRDWMSIQEALR